MNIINIKNMLINKQMLKKHMNVSDQLKQIKKQ